jgi:hypothetical protein
MYCWICNAGLCIGQSFEVHETLNKLLGVTVAFIFSGNNKKTFSLCSVKIAVAF